MPPILKSAPTPLQLADAWVRQARPALEEAAGSDMRLESGSHGGSGGAVRDHEGMGRFAADNLQAFFNRTGQRSVGVDVFLRAEHARILAEAGAVAGPGNRVSLAEGATLPVELRTDFLALRGRVPELQPLLTGRALVDASIQQAKDALASGTAAHLNLAPRVVRGRQPIVEDVAHTIAGHSFDVYVANRNIWISMASSTPSGLAGWYHVGKAPIDV